MIGGAFNQPTWDLERIFLLMRQLNEKGIQNPRIGTSSQHSKSLKETLRDTCDALAQKLRSRPIQYIELGPEPVKTASFGTSYTPGN